MSAGARRACALIVFALATVLVFLRAAPGSGAAPDATIARTIDVNDATAAQLDLLPRIGPVLAQRIVDDRAEHGPFDSLDDMQRVRGIGPKTVARLAPHATAR